MNTNTGECETHADGIRSALSFVFFYFIFANNYHYPLPHIGLPYTIHCAFKVHPFIANSDIDHIFSLALPSQLSISISMYLFL